MYFAIVRNSFLCTFMWLFSYYISSILSRTFVSVNLVGIKVEAGDTGNTVIKSLLILLSKYLATSGKGKI